MVAVPTDPDPYQRAWRQRLAYVGLPDTMRSGPGIGIGPVRSGREADPAPRPKPPAQHMRSERPAPPRSTAEHIWPGLRR